MPWFDLGTWEALTFHASGSAGALIYYRLIAWLIERMIRNQPLKSVLDGIHDVVIVGIFLFLLYQMAEVLWSRRFRRNGE